MRVQRILVADIKDFIADIKDFIKLYIQPAYFFWVGSFDFNAVAFEKFVVCIKGKFESKFLINYSTLTVNYLSTNHFIRKTI